MSILIGLIVTALGAVYLWTSWEWSQGRAKAVRDIPPLESFDPDDENAPHPEVLSVNRRRIRAYELGAIPLGMIGAFIILIGIAIAIIGVDNATGVALGVMAVLLLFAAPILGSQKVKKVIRGV